MEPLQNGLDHPYKHRLARDLYRLQGHIYEGQTYIRRSGKACAYIARQPYAQPRHELSYESSFL